MYISNKELHTAVDYAVSAENGKVTIPLAGTTYSHVQHMSFWSPTDVYLVPRENAESTQALPGVHQSTTAVGTQEWPTSKEMLGQRVVNV